MKIQIQKVWDFTTAPLGDYAKPVITYFHPAQGATAVPGNTAILLVFDRPIEAASGGMEIKLKEEAQGGDRRATGAATGSALGRHGGRSLLQSEAGGAAGSAGEGEAVAGGPQTIMVSDAQISGTNWTITPPVPLSSGTWIITVAPGVVRSVVNVNNAFEGLACNQYTFTIDTCAPANFPPPPVLIQTEAPTTTPTPAPTKGVGQNFAPGTNPPGAAGVGVGPGSGSGGVNDQGEVGPSDEDAPEMHTIMGSMLLVGIKEEHLYPADRANIKTVIKDAVGDICGKLGDRDCGPTAEISFNTGRRLKDWAHQGHHYQRRGMAKRRPGVVRREDAEDSLQIRLKIMVRTGEAAKQGADDLNDGAEDGSLLGALQAAGGTLNSVDEVKAKVVPVDHFETSHLPIVNPHQIDVRGIEPDDEPGITYPPSNGNPAQTIRSFSVNFSIGCEPGLEGHNDLRATETHFYGGFAGGAKPKMFASEAVPQFEGWEPSFKERWQDLEMPIFFQFDTDQETYDLMCFVIFLICVGMFVLGYLIARLFRCGDRHLLDDTRFLWEPPLKLAVFIICGPEDDAAYQARFGINVEMDEIQREWACEHCHRTFDHYTECVEHEKEHVAEKIAKARKDHGVVGQFLKVVDDDAAASFLEEVQLRLDFQHEEYKALDVEMLMEEAVEAKLSLEELERVTESNSAHDTLTALLLDRDRNRIEKELATKALPLVQCPGARKMRSDHAKKHTKAPGVFLGVGGAAPEPEDDLKKEAEEEPSRRIPVNPESALLVARRKVYANMKLRGLIAQGKEMGLSATEVDVTIKQANAAGVPGKEAIIQLLLATEEAQTKPGDYECDACGALYPSYDAAERCEASHAEGASALGSYECDGCGKMYPDYDGAAACEAAHDKGSGKAGSYECDGCHKRYRDYNSAAACEVSHNPTMGLAPGLTPASPSHTCVTVNPLVNLLDLEEYDEEIDERLQELLDRKQKAKKKIAKLESQAEAEAARAADKEAQNAVLRAKVQQLQSVLKGGGGVVGGV